MPIAQPFFRVALFIASALVSAMMMLLVPLASGAEAEISGTVSNAEGGEALGKIAVSIVAANSGAAVNPTPASSTPASSTGAIKFSTVTSADGKFHFSGVPAGNYILEIRGLGYRTTTEAFVVGAEGGAKEFLIELAPDTFRRKETVEVHGEVFEPAAWPAIGDVTMSSSELLQTSTVLVNDPYRSLQSLPGVSASANDDLLAQFSVMGAPYEQVGVYVDDVRVPNLLHTLPGVADQPSLSLFTGNDVDELHLMPVAYPMRYAEDSGAALAITSRSGSEGAPHFHVAAGLADSEFLGEGGFAAEHHGTWLFNVRKSYVGYLEHFFNSVSFSDIGLYDADVKVTYDLTAAHSFSLFATGGQTHLRDPSLPAGAGRFRNEWFWIHGRRTCVRASRRTIRRVCCWRTIWIASGPRAAFFRGTGARAGLFRRDIRCAGRALILPGICSRERGCRRFRWRMSLFTITHKTRLCSSLNNFGTTA